MWYYKAKIIQKNHNRNKLKTSLITFTRQINIFTVSKSEIINILIIFILYIAFVYKNLIHSLSFPMWVFIIELFIHTFISLQAYFCFFMHNYLLANYKWNLYLCWLKYLCIRKNFMKTISGLWKSINDNVFTIEKSFEFLYLSTHNYRIQNNIYIITNLRRI